MKALILTILIGLVGGFATWFSTGTENQPVTDAIVSSEPTAAKQPVLVELFTSEGCSSCPPADRVLTVLQNDQLVRNADVITLEFHVDYWNYLGWKDPFSSPAYTRRQQAYARQFGLDSSYTPQMVVDGSREFVGSNRATANDTISKSAAEPKAAVELSLGANNLQVNVSDLGSHADATVYLAVAESKLVTKVGGGENSGSTLEHTSVVRELTPIGALKASEKSLRIDQPIQSKAGWKSENVKYVVFVQENSTLKVLAVRQTGR